MTIQHAHTNSYHFDEIGNNRWTALNNSTNHYTANQLNQYTAIDTTELSYNPDGNLTHDGAYSYTWDAENRLVAVYEGNTLIISNAYDYASRRVLKATSTATHTYLYDGWNLVQETVAASTGITTNYYVWGKDLSGTMQGAGGVGGLLAVCVDNSCYFPLYDNNGNITDYVSENGTIVAKYSYDAFGNTISTTGSLANVFPHRFSTKYHDPETSLYYYGYRFYSPALMRWLNRDPIEEEGGLNLYGFVGNSPLVELDPLGLDWHVKRFHLGWAVARRDDRIKDTLGKLSNDVNLWLGEILEWARKDRFGTKFSSIEEINQACELYIPNEIFLLLPETIKPTWSQYVPGLNYVSVLRSRESIRLRRDLWNKANLFAARGFSLTIVDYDEDIGFSPSFVVWPAHGFILGGHGLQGEIKLASDVATIPSDFMTPNRRYGLGLVYVFGCFASMEKWEQLGNPNAYIFVSPKRPVFRIELPAPQVPPK